MTADTALPPDPGKLLQVDVPYVDTAGPAGLVEEAKKGLAGAGEDYFAQQKAAEALASANNRYNEALHGQHQREEQKIYVDRRNQEIFARDANHNGKSDFQEIQAEKDRQLGLFIAKPVALGFGAAQLLGVRGTFAALAMPPAANSWSFGAMGPTQAFAFVALARLGQVVDPQMTPPQLFGSRSEISLNGPDVGVNPPYALPNASAVVADPATALPAANDPVFANAGGQAPSSSAGVADPAAALPAANLPAANDPVFEDTGGQTPPSSAPTPPARVARRPSAATMDVAFRPSPPTWARNGGRNG